jgi:hypothetical protein
VKGDLEAQADGCFSDYLKDFAADVKERVNKIELGV